MGMAHCILILHVVVIFRVVVMFAVERKIFLCSSSAHAYSTNTKNVHYCSCNVRHVRSLQE
jgi:hypothetical protein